jgi:diguanylate cyclase (GGDEF)-like protein
MEYVTDYLFLPLGCNLLVLLLGAILLRALKASLFWSEFIPILQMGVILTVFALTYNRFGVLIGTLCFTLFIGAAFDRVSGLCVALFFALYEAYQIQAYRAEFSVMHNIADPYGNIEVVVAIVTILVAFFISRDFLTFQLRKIELLTRVHEREVRLQAALDRDSKTGLYSSTYFNNALEKAVARSPEKLMLMILDIDDFKSVNDRFGHSNGDVVLLRLAELMKAYFRDEECPSRFGGEELTAIVTSGTEEEMRRRCEAFRQEFANQNYPFTSERITFSIGIASLENGWDARKFFDYADAALYQAKKQGKNCTCMWNDMMDPLGSGKEASHEF